MVHAEHKAERLATNARMKAKLQAKLASQVTPLDLTSNAERKAKVRAFWAGHAARFQSWWVAHKADSEVVRTLLRSHASPPNTQIQSTSTELTAAHEALLPELSPRWLCSHDGSSGLAWLMQTRAEALLDGVHTDDPPDIETVRRLQLAGREAGRELAPFPGLTTEQIDDGFCGLGNSFGPSGLPPLARGEEVLALGRHRLDLLTADLQGRVARCDVFRWAMYRQEHIFSLLLEAAEAFLLTEAESASAAKTLTDGDPVADAALQQALSSCDLQTLREVLDLHAEGASTVVVQAARAERDRLAKKAKKERAKAKKAAPGEMHTMGCAVAMEAMTLE
jgi:hypothetical protein